MPTSTNQRQYWPITAVAFATLGTTLLVTGYKAAKGVQDFSASINFSVDPVFQMGQIEPYEQIEGIPQVEVSITKVLDGKPLLQHLATPGASASSLAGRYQDQRTMIAAAYFPITQDYASGTPLSVAVFSGFYVNSINWNFPVEGNFTEQVTFVGNDRTWFNAPSGQIWTTGVYPTGTTFNGEESPIASGGGVQRRENLDMTRSLWPTQIPGISGDGKIATLSDGSQSAHPQNVTVSCDLGRTDLFELGRRGPYYKFANFPIPVTTTIELTLGEYGDGINAAQEGTNLLDQTIKIVTNSNVSIDLGTKNKLSSMNIDGGGTDGSNVTGRFQYTNNNIMKVIASGYDPAGFVA